MHLILATNSRDSSLYTLGFSRDPLTQNKQTKNLGEVTHLCLWDFHSTKRTLRQCSSQLSQGLGIPSNPHQSGRVNAFLNSLVNTNHCLSQAQSALPLVSSSPWPQWELSHCVPGGGGQLSLLLPMVGWVADFFFLVSPIPQPSLSVSAGVPHFHSLLSAFVALVPVILCNFSWEDMNKSPTDRRNDST